jgi:hypothetical protein
MDNQSQKEQETKKRKDRDTHWTLWETFIECYVVITIKDKFSQGKGGPEMIHEFNILFPELVDEWEQKERLKQKHQEQTNRLPPPRTLIMDFTFTHIRFGRSNFGQG